jgi:hypothetical protein
MKKIPFVFLVAVLSLSFVGTSMAAGFKVPKNMCLRLAGPGLQPVITIAISKGGTVQITANEKVAFNSFQGVILDDNITGPIPIQGSGYVKGSVFHFTFTGTYLFNDIRTWTIAAEGQWDLASGTGEAAVIRLSGAGDAYESSWPLEEVACDTLAIP